jgi:hypothetical protein
MGARKQNIGIVATVIDRKHELAAFVGTCSGLFDFEAIAGAGMEPHAAKPSVGSAANDFRESNAVGEQLRDLAGTCEITEAETTGSFVQKGQLCEFLYLVAGQPA